MDGVAKTDDHAAKVVAHRKEHEKHEAYKAERMERQSGEGPHRAHCTSRTHVASWLRGLSTPAHSMRMLPCWRSMKLAHLHENATTTNCRHCQLLAKQPLTDAAENSQSNNSAPPPHCHPDRAVNEGPKKEGAGKGNWGTYKVCYQAACSSTAAQALTM